MYPNVSKLFIEGVNDGERLNYWENVHSLDMTPMKSRMVGELTQEAWVEVVDDKNVVTNRHMLIEHDLNTCSDEELDFEAPFELYLRDDESAADAVEVHQLVVSFDIDFSVPGTNMVSFSTGCQTPPTHWKQTVSGKNLIDFRIIFWHPGNSLILCCYHHSSRYYGLIQFTTVQCWEVVLL